MNKTRPLIEQFRESEDLQRELLKPRRFAAFQNGDLQINSFSDFNRAVLLTLRELGLEE